MSTRNDPRRDTVWQVKADFEAGLTVREIATALGLSTQRVHQHLARLRDMGELPPKDEVAS